MSLSGKTAVVTGGGRGIGSATARALAAAGAAVAVSARTVAEIEDLASELEAGGHAAWAIPCDVAEPEQIESLAEQVLERMGRIDILVNCAGISRSAPLRGTTLDDWDRQMAVNARGTFLCTQAFLPGMVERGWGRVINIASTAGRIGMPYISAYTASKHAVVGFTRSVAAEVARRGVTVNAVCPGYVDTPMTDGSIERIVEKTGKSREETRAYLEGLSPQGRMMQPEEIAFLVVALCDERAGGINGQAIVLDGGAVQA